MGGKNGPSHPPKKRTAITSEINVMPRYSPTKNKPNFRPEYSVWYPSTSSLSASGRSKGSRCVSPRPAIKKITNPSSCGIQISATPGPYELTRSAGVVVEQVIRPTGLIDPEVEIRPVKGQVDDLLAEIRDRAKRNERVLVTTLTKRMSEDLAGYYTEVGVRCRYMHSEIETLERVKLLAGLRKGEYDALIGINLLREGLDLPEVSLVAILDADKEGFLRSTGSLIQTMGRAARHLEGKAILYADRITDSMRRAMDETDRRRTIQRAYNEEHGITPQSIISRVDMGLAAILKAEYGELVEEETIGVPEFATQAELDAFIGKLETEMRDAAKKFEFEKAAKLRDSIKELREKEFLFG